VHIQVFILSVGAITSIDYDTLIAKHLSDNTVILVLFAMNTATFALLADMIDKRSQYIRKYDHQICFLEK
jgi:hypothetical protein